MSKDGRAVVRKEFRFKAGTPFTFEKAVGKAEGTYVLYSKDISSGEEDLVNYVLLMFIDKACSLVTIAVENDGGGFLVDAPSHYDKDMAAEIAKNLEADINGPWRDPTLKGASAHEREIAKKARPRGGPGGGGPPVVITGKP